jgi:hypothetical protein
LLENALLFIQRSLNQWFVKNFWGKTAALLPNKGGMSA